MTAHAERVALALRAAAVESPTSYAWFGRASRPLPAGVAASIGAEATRAFLVQGLEGVLYRSFYSQGAPAPLSAHAAVPAPPDPAFVAALSDVNAGRGGWQPGWCVERVEPLVVGHDGLRVHAEPADCRPAGAAPGADVSVRRPKEHRSASAGYYTALGDAPFTVGGDDRELRVYFHLTAAGAAPLLATGTRVLNHAGVPFALKVVDNPSRLPPLRRRRSVPPIRGLRPCPPGAAGDTDGVRAAPAGERARVRQAARRRRGGRRAPARPRRELRGEPVPAGRRGHRRGPRAGASALEARLAAVARRFAERGLDLDEPYLLAGSEDRYGL